MQSSIRIVKSDSDGKPFYQQEYSHTYTYVCIYVYNFLTVIL